MFPAIKPLLDLLPGSGPVSLSDLSCEWTRRWQVPIRKTRDPGSRLVLLSRGVWCWAHGILSLA